MDYRWARGSVAVDSGPKVDEGQDRIVLRWCIEDPCNKWMDPLGIGRRPQVG